LVFNTHFPVPHLRAGQSLLAALIASPSTPPGIGFSDRRFCPDRGRSIVTINWANLLLTFVCFGRKFSPMGCLASPSSLSGTLAPRDRLVSPHVAGGWKWIAGIPPRYSIFFLPFFLLLLVSARKKKLRGVSVFPCHFSPPSFVFSANWMIPGSVVDPSFFQDRRSTWQLGFDLARAGPTGTGRID